MGNLPLQSEYSLEARFKYSQGPDNDGSVQEAKNQAAGKSISLSGLVDWGQRKTCHIRDDRGVMTRTCRSTSSCC